MGKERNRGVGHLPRVTQLIRHMMGFRPMYLDSWWLSRWLVLPESLAPFTRHTSVGRAKHHGRDTSPWINSSGKVNSMNSCPWLTKLKCSSERRLAPYHFCSWTRWFVAMLPIALQSTASSGNKPCYCLESSKRGALDGWELTGKRGSTAV